MHAGHRPSAPRPSPCEAEPGAHPGWVSNDGDAVRGSRRELAEPFGDRFGRRRRRSPGRTRHRCWRVRSQRRWSRGRPRSPTIRGACCRRRAHGSRRSAASCMEIPSAWALAFSAPCSPSVSRSVMAIQRSNHFDTVVVGISADDVVDEVSTCQPRLVKRARPTTEPGSQSSRGVLGTASPDQCLDQCVLEDFALGVGTTEQRHVVLDREKSV